MITLEQWLSQNGIDLHSDDTLASIRRVMLCGMESHEGFDDSNVIPLFENMINKKFFLRTSLGLQFGYSELALRQKQYKLRYDNEIEMFYINTDGDTKLTIHPHHILEKRVMVYKNMDVQTEDDIQWSLDVGAIELEQTECPNGKKFVSYEHWAVGSESDWNVNLQCYSHVPLTDILVELSEEDPESFWIEYDYLEEAIIFTSKEEGRALKEFILRPAVLCDVTGEHLSHAEVKNQAAIKSRAKSLTFDMDFISQDGLDTLTEQERTFVLDSVKDEDAKNTILERIRKALNALEDDACDLNDTFELDKHQELISLLRKLS